MRGRTHLCGTTSIAALLLSAAPASAQTANSTEPTTPQSEAPAAPTETTENSRAVAQVALPIPGDAVEAGGDVAQGGDIIVTGLRRSVQSSQAIKRQSDQIVDAIVAEDIGKLPDLSASAALARVTGVQVNRAAGEAAGVQIRGLPDISTTYNSREIFTAEGRNVAIQDFPAGSVAALEVYKSSTANLIEGGIGGQVNVRSRRPFDFDGFEAFGAVNGVYTDQGSKVDGNGNFLISNRWNTGIGEIGVLVNAAYSRQRALDSLREQSLAIGPDFARRTEFPFRYPDSQSLSYTLAQRARPSGTATIQWKPAPELEIYADALFQGYRAETTNNFLSVPLFGGQTFSNVVLQDDGRRAQSLTAAGGTRPDGFTGIRLTRTDTYQGAAGAIYNKDGLRVSADVAYTDSTFSVKAYNVDYAFASTPVRDVNFDVPRGEGGPEFNFRDFDATDPANYIYRGLFQENLRVGGDGIQARTDLEYETGFDLLPRIQFGARYDDRSAFRRRGDLYRPGENRRVPLAALPVDLETVGPGFGYDDIQPLRVFVQPTFDSIRANIANIRTFAGAPAGDPPFDPAQAFDAKEKTYTAYGQIKYAFDLGVLIDGVIGVRAIETKTTVAGVSRNLQANPVAGAPNVVTLDPVSRSNEYDDVLPNASLRASLTEEVQLRLGYTQTRTRPSFNDLNPSGSISPPSGACIANPTIPNSGPDSPDCRRDFSGGNPNLNPLTSNNYDVSLEWYFSRAGSLTGALFRRDVQGFISRVTIDTDDPQFGRLRSNTPQNGGQGRIQGAEAALAAFLDFEGLPGWARGFGVQANYTYIDAKAELAPVLAETLPGQQRLPGVSKHAFNIIGLYERPKFSTRVAYNYRSSFVDSYGRAFDPSINPAPAVPGGPAPNRNGPTLPLIQEGIGFLDFSANVTPIPNITVQFDVSNILGTTRKLNRAYDTFGGDAFPRQVVYLERIFSLGVRFRL